MSLQFETPIGGLGAFWARFAGTRRRGLQPARSAAPSPSPERRDPEPRRDSLRAVPKHLAAHQQWERRMVLSAEALADSYLNGLAVADFAFRLLKNEFDELCEQAEIALVSDKRFAGWLAEHGCRRYRDGWPKVTMYTIRHAPRVKRAA